MRRIIILIIAMLLIQSCSNEPEDTTTVYYPTIVTTTLVEPILPEPVENISGQNESMINETIEEQPLLNALEVHFINVTRGDSALIVLPNKKKILFDAGPKDAGFSLIEYLGQKNARVIDLAFSSHADPDHYGGFIELINHMRFERLLSNGEDSSSWLYSNFTQSATMNENYGIIEDPMSFDLDPRVEVKVLVPYYERDRSSKKNDDSLLLRVDYKNVSFLITGDCTKRCEEDILLEALSIDVLKIANMGAATATSDDFLIATTPNLAIISTGPNVNDYPDAEVLQRLKNHNIPLLRTDQNGTIIIKTDGNRIVVETD